MLSGDDVIEMNMQVGKCNMNMQVGICNITTILCCAYVMMSARYTENKIDAMQNMHSMPPQKE